MKRLLTTPATANGLRRVVVTGIGAQTPLGNTFDSTWNTLVSTDMTPEKGITTLEEALLIQNLPQDVLDRDLKNSKLIPSQVAAPVRDVQYDARTSRFVQFALHAAREAIEASKLSDHLGLHSQDTVSDDILYNRTRTGTCIASGMSSIREVVSNQDIMERKNSIRRISPHFVPKILCNAPSSRVSLDLHLHGPNLAPSTACAAGAHAIGEASRSIQYGDADIMIAGGTEACIDPLSMAGFCRLKALSTRYNDDPIASSRPFDKDRDGFVMGEGCAIIILEELHHALERGAPILCEISGYGVSGDAYHVTSPDPDGKGAERAMQMALQRAGVKPSQVDYLNAHATSTPMGDEIEERVVKRLLCDNAVDRESALHISSTKGATGHLLGAAGALESAFTINALATNLVPHTRNLHLDDPHAQDNFHHVVDAPFEKEMNVAINNSFGFGGTNASLVFSRFKKS